MFFFQNKTGNAYYFGSAISISNQDGKSAPNPTTLRKLLKAQKKAFRKYRKENGPGLDLKKVVLIASATVTAEFTAFAFIYDNHPDVDRPGPGLQATKTAMVVLPLSVLTYLVILPLAPVISGLIRGIGAGKLHNAFSDANGWNWSIRPDKVKNEDFELYLNFVDPKFDLKNKLALP